MNEKPNKRGGKRDNSGRKKMNEEEKMQTMTFTISTEQKNILIKEAKESGMKISMYIRKKLFE